MKYYLGVDPSTVSTGYGVFNSKGELVEHGVIQSEDDLAQHEKIGFNYLELKKIFVKYKISGLCCEEQFGGRNMDTLKKLCQVTGVVMLLAAENKIPFSLKYPASWRKLFHGKGNVKKADTLLLVNEKYGLELRKKDNDMADGIGLAYCAYLLGENLLDK